MASQAHAKFAALLIRSMLLTKQAATLKKQEQAASKLVFLHAALTSQVAAWDVYVKALSTEYFQFTARRTLLCDPLRLAAAQFDSHLTTDDAALPWADLGQQAGGPGFQCC